MVTGAHFLLYSKEPEADRAFIRDVLGFASVDVGGGWLIFKLPPSELAVHPSEEDFVQGHADHALAGFVLYLMCDDLRAMMKTLESKKVKCSEVGEERWGIRTTFRLPSGGEIGLYQPTHPTALEL